MARRVTRPTAPTTLGAKQKPIKVENAGIKDYFLSTRDMVMSHRFRLAMGIVLIVITLIT